MNLHKFFRAACLAVVGIMIYTGAAFAYSAQATVSLNVRSGPSPSYSVVDTLYSGEQVNVERCSASQNWCYITHSGPDGWVSAKYLSRANSGGNSGSESGSNTGTKVEYNARATVALNVRSSPSTNAPIVDALYSGERVKVSRCTDSWCYVSHDGTNGWVSSKYLSRTSSGGGAAEENKNPGFSLQFGSDGEFSFNIGNRPEPKFEEEGQACFYRDFNYGGKSFCLAKGESVSLLEGSWNDSISSIRVEGDIQVTACMHENFGGTCIFTEDDIARIRSIMNDEISSIRVR